MDFTGTVKVILPIQSGTGRNGNEWRSQQAVITDGGQYPKEVVVTQFNDSIDQQRLIVGRQVKVYLNPTVNEWNGKYFQQIGCYKVENLDAAPQPQYSQPPPQPVAPQAPADDLPF